MSKKVDALMEKFNATASAKEAEQLLKEIDTLSRRDQLAAATAFEKGMLQEIDGIKLSDGELFQAEAMLEILEKLGPLGQMLAGSDTPEDQEGFESALFLSRSIAKVIEIKGDKADQKLKVFAEEAKKIPDSQFNTEIGQLKLMISFSRRLSEMDGTAPATPKGNPFSKGM